MNVENWTKRIAVGILAGSMLGQAGSVALGAEFASAGRNEPSRLEVAAVPSSLKIDQSYCQYACMLIEIDQLSHPLTATFDLRVFSPKPGLIVIEGSVPNEKAKEYVINNARRISGLDVREGLRLRRQESEFAVQVDPQQLELQTRETMLSLFPREAENVRFNVEEDRSIILSGEVSSLETKLMLSQALKSQPGAAAVVNLLVIAPDRQNGDIRVSETGELRLAAATLPQVPAAPIVDFDSAPSLSAVSENKERAPAMAADDAPTGKLLDRQVREDVMAALRQERSLDSLNLEVSVEYGVVTINGPMRKEQVDLALDTASSVSEIRKVVVKGSSFTVQRNIPHEGVDAAKDKKETKPEKDSGKNSVFSVLALPFHRKESQGEVLSDRRLRSLVKRSISKRCGNRIKNLDVQSGLDGVRIVAEVDNTRDRTFVLREIDQIAELRNNRYDVQLRTKEFE